MITIVSCIADRELFNKCLGRCLKEQNVLYKFIEAPLKIHDKKPASAQMPECYNSVKDKLDTKYVAFIHIDIAFLEYDWLKRAEQFCDNIPDLGVAGVAGKSWGGKCTGYIVHMGHPTYSCEYYERKYNGLIFGTNPIISPELSQTLDQMVVIVPTKIFKEIQFDESFDVESPMYLSEDYCLAVKHRFNLNSYALPLRTWHSPFWSSQTESDQWDYRGRKIAHDKAILEKAKQLIIRKWRLYFPLIFATCDIDVCPNCKINPCICAKPLNMSEALKLW